MSDLERVLRELARLTERLREVADRRAAGAPGEPPRRQPPPPPGRVTPPEPMAR